MNEPIADVWVQTYSGRRYYPENPKSAEISVVDIAHALSLLCRFGGHIDTFYSVAEHCVLLSRWVDEKNALAALLHDATEAYVVDVPRPLKYLLPDYRKIENQVWEAITERYGIDLILPEQVKEGDNRILLNERNVFMSNAERWTIDGLATPLPIEVYGWPPLKAETEYLKRFIELVE